MFLLLVVSWALVPMNGQTTQASLSGRITDRETAAAIPGVSLQARHSESGLETRAVTREGGWFVIAGLTPGVYLLVAEASGYQTQQIHDLALPVASNTVFDLELRRTQDVWEQRAYQGVAVQPNRAVLRFYGPDLDPARTTTRPAPDLSRTTREPVISDVITTEQLRALPLAGRDAYTLLFRQPGVTNDAGSARGLGLAAYGQRPSASSFLLDGMENNNFLTSGPLHTIPPESIQEYRISTGTFSAEFGRASGFIANAVTSQGGGALHLIAYYFGRHHILNANSFQRNLSGLSRASLTEWQPGATVTGPLRKERLFFSAAHEWFHTRTTSLPVTLQLPSAAYRQFTSADSLARRLLDPVSAQLPQGSTFVAAQTFDPAVSLDRSVSLGRLDYSRDAHRLFFRLLNNRLTRPDFVWTPYRDFTSTLRQRTSGAMLSWIAPVRGMLNELRGGWQADTLSWDRPHPEIPTLTATNELQTPGVTTAPAVLPGSPAFYAYRNHSRNIEVVENLSGWRGAHSWKLGGALLLRSLDGYLTAGRDGNILFDDLFSFLADQPNSFIVSTSRDNPSTVPDFGSRHQSKQVSLFAQDVWRVRKNLLLNFGLRYESFGVPVTRASGKALYDADRNNLAPRVGLSWQPAGDFGPVLRLAYGVFYDRPFDNLWQNLRSNSFTLASAGLSWEADYLAGMDALIRLYRPVALTFPEPLRYQDHLRDAYSQNFFVGVLHGLGDHLSLEVDGIGALARKLITTDRINRPFTIGYRANQGISSYHGLSASGRYRSGSLNLRATYTWSHWIDNQSEPLAGDFFNLDFTRANYSADRPAAAFSRAGDSRGDRGDSDFDQRHNFGVSAIWDIPKLKGWRIAGLAAIRSGFPYTAYAPETDFDASYLYNRRASVIGPYSVDQAVGGGRRLLNRAAFLAPPAGAQGNLGRNALRGPGLYNFDLSIGKTFAVAETVRITLRADVFNFLNHANLNSPAAVLASDDFGVAQYGRTGRDTGFPALFPLNETPRQIQLLLRFEF